MEFASVTFAVKLYVPVAVGVPEINPVDDASESPVGKEPELTDHVYGSVPEVAVSTWA